MTIRNCVTTLLATAVVASAVAGAQADPLGTSSVQHKTDTVPATYLPGRNSDRLLIVNGHSGRVVYDDGNDDLFCVTRKVIIGYDESGDPIRKRVMRCR